MGKITALSKVKKVAVWCGALTVIVGLLGAVGGYAWKAGGSLVQQQVRNAAVDSALSASSKRQDSLDAKTDRIEGKVNELQQSTARIEGKLDVLIKQNDHGLTLRN